MEGTITPDLFDPDVVENQSNNKRAPSPMTTPVKQSDENRGGGAACGSQARAVFDIVVVAMEGDPANVSGVNQETTKGHMTPCVRRRVARAQPSWES